MDEVSQFKFGSGKKFGIPRTGAHSSREYMRVYMRNRRAKERATRQFDDVRFRSWLWRLTCRKCRLRFGLDVSLNPHSC